MQTNLIPSENYNVVCRTTYDSIGVIIATYPSKELADMTSKVMNDTTPLFLLHFFSVEKCSRN